MEKKWQATKAVEDNVYCILDREGRQVARFTNPDAKNNVDLAVRAPEMEKRINLLEGFVKDFLDNFGVCAECEGSGKDAFKDTCYKCAGTGRAIESRGILFVELPEEARRLLKGESNG